MKAVSPCVRTVAPAAALWAGVLAAVGLLAVASRSEPPAPAKSVPAPAGAQRVPSSSAAPVAPPDLSADTRLNAPITTEAKSQPLADCLPALDSAGVMIRASPPMAQRRVTVFAARLPLRRLMEALADTLGLSWQRENTPAPTPGAAQDKGQQDKSQQDADPQAKNAPANRAPNYTLFQSDEARRRERKQLAASEAWNMWAHDAKRDAMQAALQAALNATGNDKHPANPLRGLLADLSPKQIDQACELATQSMGVGAADNNRNLLQNLVGVRPFADLPPAQQAQARALLGRPEQTAGGKGDGAVPGAKNDDELSRSSVGFAAIEGAVSLAVVKPDGSDVLFSPQSGVFMRSIPALASDDDSDPEVRALTQNVRLLDLSGVPDAVRRKRLRFPSALDRAALPELLQSLARQTGLAIVADDFIRSRRTVYFWLLTDKPDYTLDEACDQISKAFGHRMIYKNSVLRVQSVSPGPDLRVEPPPQIIARLRDMTAHHLLGTLDDYAMLGGLTRAQLDTFVLAHFPGVAQGTLLINAQRAYSVLHFYALLPPDLRERATTSAGLPFSALNARQTEAFAALSQLGAMRAATGKASMRPTGLYVRAEEVTAKYSRGKALCWTFDVVPDKQSGRVASYTLEP